MRSEKEMFDLILDFARQDDNIRAVVLNGSRANPNAPRDPFQDYDIACLVRDMAPYIRNPEIPRHFGEILILQQPENMQDPPAENDGHYTYLMLFKDGNRIDLSFAPAEQFKAAIADSQTIALLDKDGLLPGLPPASDADYLVKPPTDKQFQDCCNEFWWCSPYVAKALWRDELTYAKEMLDGAVREQLMKMLTWYFGGRTGFCRSAGKMGKYLRAGVEPEIWTQLELTYSDAKFENIWNSLFSMGSLFRQLAHEVAQPFGFAYPQTDDDNVTAFLRRIRNLPTDAKELD